MDAHSAFFSDIPIEEAAQPLWLETASVLSKWGLGDGDRPDWLIDIAEREVDWHEVLFLAVSRYWEPLLPERATLYRIGTSHNPVGISHYGERAVDLRYSNWDEQDIIPHVSISVPAADVARLVREALCASTTPKEEK